jgi:hypothetical protein
MQLLRMGGNLEEDVVAVDNPKLAGHSFGQILKKLKNSEKSCGILKNSRIPVQFPRNWKRKNDYFCNILKNCGSRARLVVCVCVQWRGRGCLRKNRGAGSHVTADESWAIGVVKCHVAILLACRFRRQ